MSRRQIPIPTPTFINNSGLPVNLETWQPNEIPGLQSLNVVLVRPGEQIVFTSTTGEWYLQTFLNKEFAYEWEAACIITGNQIGKFRNEPCVSGDYVWMDDKKFDILYDPNNHIATFIKNKK
jgi:hypothetical protein